MRETWLNNRIENSEFVQTDLTNDNLGWIPIEDNIVVMSELIEHLPVYEAELLIKKVMSFNPKRLIITTPNKDFNVNFRHDGLRIEDHQWEMGIDQFREFIYNIGGRVVQVGDKVDGSSVTLGAIL